MLTSIIILNWNGKQFLKNCIDSILKQKDIDYEIVLVDNASTDDSVAFIKKQYTKELKSKLVTLIITDKNYGFAEGNNIGIRHALKNKNVEKIVILNNDTVVDKNWLKELADSLKDSKADCAFSKSLTPKGKLDSMGGSISKNGIYYERKNSDIPFNSIGGCSCIYTRKALQSIKIGSEFFDKDFFCYYEDVDLGIRLQLQKNTIAYAEKSIVYHHGGASSNSSFKLFHSFRNQIYFIIKTYPTWTFLKYLPIIIAGQILQIGNSLIRDKSLIIFKAKFVALQNLKIMLQKRKTIQKNKKLSRIEFEHLLTNQWLISK